MVKQRVWVSKKFSSGAIEDKGKFANSSLLMIMNAQGQMRANMTIALFKAIEVKSISMCVAS
jgi:hypothetical protein